MPTIGEIVRNLRESMGLSREQLAESSGLSKGYLADLEQDRFESVTTDTLKALRSAMPKLECQQILDAAPPAEKPIRRRGRPPATPAKGRRKG